MEHTHIRSHPDDPNRDVLVRCDSPVCWAIGARRGNRTTDEQRHVSPFVRRALARELPGKVLA